MALPPIRSDLSNKLIHLMKGEIAGQRTTAAFNTLRTILREQKLRGGTGYIKGYHRCVCFSEAPIAAVAHLCAQPHPEFKYEPFGIMVDKRWLYDRDGRSVIYQRDEGYDRLHDDIKHLHVRYEPDAIPAVDFTWEREWRVKCDELPFTPADVTVVVPSRRWADALVEEHTELIRTAVRAEAQISSFADAEVQPFPWHLVALSDLGVDIP